MRFRHLLLMMLMVLVILCLDMNWIVTTRQRLPTLHDMPAVEIQHNHENKCPPCELFFRKLESTGENGKLVQDVKVQERGEPKSGTSFMYDWATGTLIRTCDYMQYLFGAETVVGFDSGRNVRECLCVTCINRLRLPRCSWYF